MCGDGVRVVVLLGLQRLRSVGPGVHQRHGMFLCALCAFGPCHERCGVCCAWLRSRLCTVCGRRCVLLGLQCGWPVGQRWNRRCAFPSGSACDDGGVSNYGGIVSHVCAECGKRFVLLGLQRVWAVWERVREQFQRVEPAVHTRVEWCEGCVWWQGAHVCAHCRWRHLVLGQ